MKIYYTLNHPDIIECKLNADAIFFTESNLSEDEVLVFEIDEISDNKELIVDVLQTRYLYNAAGQKKYYVENGELFSRDGWIPE